MVWRPTRANENRPRHPRASGGPITVHEAVDSRFRGNDARGAIFRRVWTPLPTAYYLLRTGCCLFPIP
jgi:hypothetical protein